MATVVYQQPPFNKWGGMEGFGQAIAGAITKMAKEREEQQRKAALAQAAMQMSSAKNPEEFMKAVVPIMRNEDDLFTAAKTANDLFTKNIKITKHKLYTVDDQGLRSPLEYAAPADATIQDVIKDATEATGKTVTLEGPGKYPDSLYNGVPLSDAVKLNQMEISKARLAISQATAARQAAHQSTMEGIAMRNANRPHTTSTGAGATVGGKDMSVDEAAIIGRAAERHGIKPSAVTQEQFIDEARVFKGEQTAIGLGSKDVGQAFGEMFEPSKMKNILETLPKESTLRPKLEKRMKELSGEQDVSMTKEELKAAVRAAPKNMQGSVVVVDGKKKKVRIEGNELLLDDVGE